MIQFSTIFWRHAKKILMLILLDSLPHDLITCSLGEELATGNGHLNLEIYGRHVSALFAANELGFRNIICGPNQQSEIVGSHYFIHKPVKWSSF